MRSSNTKGKSYIYTKNNNAKTRKSMINLNPNNHLHYNVSFQLFNTTEEEF